ncbi:hypothetical protein GCM10027277_30350 [Pseudoduganella ginsengisoli]|uniref:Uncharacterized protein n=1 Tax=Pseudoduganella ginsengisoli TaxID=1462440 RepID=A0A6L6PYV3_9BURK|nr:hypothetical protein [Pseudoduganella ginsengisoli]MTW02446.1 hypothetical protein [Pseudoduganella ginsengisoli]
MLAKVIIGCAAAWVFNCAAAEPESYAFSGKDAAQTACAKATDLREVVLALKKQLKLQDGPEARRKTRGTARMLFMPDGTVGVECAKGMYPTVDYKVSAFVPDKHREVAEDGDSEDSGNSEESEASRIQAVEVCQREIVMACKPLDIALGRKH